MCVVREAWCEKLDLGISCYLDDASLLFRRRPLDVLSMLTHLFLELVNELLGRLLAVALRVVLGPTPEISAGLFHSVLSLPSQLGVGSSGVGGKVEDIASSSVNNLIWQVTTDSLGEGLDNLKHGAALAGPQVPGTDTRAMLTQVVEGDQVTLGEIQNVDVVPDGGSVFGSVVYKRVSDIVSES